MRKTLLMLLLALGSMFLHAAKVDTLSIYSESMKRGIPTVTITPDKASPEKRMPVIYLLNGHGGNHKTWITVRPDLPALADQYQVIFVCPNGMNSWYWDSREKADFQFETFISEELISYIDQNFPTKKSREGRAITGLSMGGHGALWNAIRHKEKFGAAGSTSGGVDIRPFPKSWNMASFIGKKENNPQVWEEHTVINQVDKLNNGDLKLIIDCGYSDFFYDVNNALHEKLCYLNIDHDYLVRPGGHNGKYWSNSILYQILFFANYFYP